MRGTYLGLASDPMIDHLLRLGITTVELLPIQAFVDERFVAAKGLAQLLGLQHPWLFRAGAALHVPRAVCGKCRAWSAACMRRGSR